MIFFTVGTERFPFDRLIRVADTVQEKLKNEEVFVQLGSSTVIPEKCAWARLLSFQEISTRLAEARIVVTHAGVGMFLLCARLGKIPVMVPREKDFGEHVDDHQMELAQKMSELGYVLLARSPQEILSLILNYEKRDLNPHHNVSTPSLAHSLLKYLGENGR